MMKYMILVLSLLVKVSFAEAPLQVAVSILPHRYLVEQIGGDRVCAVVMVPPGKSPATYSPTPGQMVALGRASIYFMADVPFESVFRAALQRSLPDLNMVDLNEGIDRRAIEGHHHGDELSNARGHDEALDPHVWMNPLLFAQQGANMVKALAQQDPDHAVQYETNGVRFAERMRQLNERVAGLLRPYKGAVIFVYHPAFGYFADAYGLIQEAVEQGGKSPTPRAVASLIKLARADKVSVIFVQPQFNQQKADVIARAINGRVESLNSLAENVPENIWRTAQVVSDAHSEQQSSCTDQ